MFINNQQITDLLSMQECIEAMEALFSLDFKKEIMNPLRSKMLLPAPNNGILGMMPAYIKPFNIMGIKVLSVFPDNYKKGLSSHQGILQLFETTTGKLLVSLDADEITAIRTAAVSAVATNILAIDKAETLCLIGSGKQAKKHLEAMLLVRPIKKVTIWSKNRGNAVKFVDEIKNTHTLDFKICDTVQEAAANADIICTVTSSNEPVLSCSYLKPDVHINAVGSCTANSRELESEIITTSDVFVDDFIAATNEAGDILIPASELHCDAHQLIKADLSRAVKDTSIIQKSNRTVFKSLGLAVEDVAAGYHCYHKHII